MQSVGFCLVVTGFLGGVALASLVQLPLVTYVFVTVLTGILAGAGWLTKRRVYALGVIVLLAALLGGMRAQSVPTSMPAVFEPLFEQRVVLEGVLVQPPDRRESADRLTVEIKKGNERMRVIAVAPPHAHYRVGDRVVLKGVLKEPEPFATDGGRMFAYDAFLAKDGIFALMQPAEVEVLGREESMVLEFRAWLQDMRDGFVRALERVLPEPQSALAAGLIAGGKQGLGKDLLTAFTVSGLLPIVVLSGYNVMIVAEGVLRALRFLPQRTAFAVGGVSIILFVLAAGAGASSFRAGLMALLALTARATGKTYAVVRALFAVLVLMLLWNPLLLVFDTGLQFSFIATLGLILGAPIVAMRLSWLRSDFLRDIVASTIAAQVAVLPLLLFHTGNLSFVSIVANVLVLPVVPGAMALGAAAAGVALLPLPEPLVALAGLPAYGLLTYIIIVAEWSAGLPFAHASIPAFPFWVVVVGYGVLAFAVWRHTKRALAKAGARTKLRNV